MEKEEHRANHRLYRLQKERDERNTKSSRPIQKMVSSPLILPPITPNIFFSRETSFDFKVDTKRPD